MIRHLLDAHTKLATVEGPDQPFMIANPEAFQARLFALPKQHAPAP